MVLTDALTDCIHRLFYESSHFPVTFATTHAEREIAKHIGALRGMHNFGMELNTVNLLLFVKHCCIGAVV